MPPSNRVSLRRDAGDGLPPLDEWIEDAEDYETGFLHGAAFALGTSLADLVARAMTGLEMAEEDGGAWEPLGDFDDFVRVNRETLEASQVIALVALVPGGPPLKMGGGACPIVQIRRASPGESAVPTK